MSSDEFKTLFNTLDKSLILPNSYFSAHRRGGELESLEAHSQLCGKYFIYIIETLGLDSIFDNLIIDLFGKKHLSEIKQILLYSIYYHDIGKINPNFQQAKVKKKRIAVNSNHSFFSEKILTSFLLGKYPELKGVIYLIGNIVSTHHTKLGDFTVKDYHESKDEREIIQHIMQKTGLEEITISEEDKKIFFLNDFNWHKAFLFLKLSYSLLVLSDSYSTMHYTYSLNTMYPLNVIDQNISEKMVESYSRIPYNTDIDEIQPIDLSFCRDINKIRREILIECNANMKQLLQKNIKIFMMAVPTGGGKTNVSMKLALNILEHDDNIKRIFYVFPYINIIEQNYLAIDKTLFDKALFPEKNGLVSDIYSRAYVDKFDSNPEEESVSNIKKMMVIQDDNFLNNCVNVITNVNFFNSYIKNGTNNRYKIVNLCNSVVIIDEIQTLSDNNIRTFYNFIRETSESLNIYYIIMSATLPNFNYFLDDVAVPQVISNPQKYYSHPVFKRNSVLFRKDVSDVSGIKNLLIEEISANYSTGRVKILVTLNVVNTSRKVYEELKSDNRFNDFSFYLLNSTTSSLRRKRMIEEIKDKAKDERIIIVSTQSIEAGVDIDCDFGIRDYSILDSIEQISGRINRECNMEKADVSKLFVIKYKDDQIADSKKIYADQLRYKILGNMGVGQEESIIASKQFDEYYGILSREVKKIAKDSFGSIESEIRELHYQSINNKLDVIDSKLEKVDIFICDEIPLDKLSEYDRYKIKSLIDDPIIKQVEMSHKIISDGNIVTKNVYKVWKDIIMSTNKFEDVYIRRKITSLLNQFVISITNIKNKTYNQDLLGYLQKEGFIEKDETFDVYFSTPKFSQYYSFNDGLRSYEIKEAIKNQSIGVII